MGLESRPYVGTWKLNNRKVVKHTPDALVYINGDLAVPGCPSCAGKIDLQKYITQVSVDPSTEGPATASISLHIPRSAGDGLVRDGNFILKPGLEVHIYLRGYFPVQGLTAGITPDQSGGVDVRNSVMYPYYLVHHGVVIDVSHEYSGGEHTASLSCVDLLHFWQYQRMSTNGSLFGARPMNSKVHMSLVGHNMTGMSPYAIIYQLFRDVMGSAGGVEFALGNTTNAAANSSVVGESLFSLAILYWQKRFAQTTTSLRMYGADGTLYNAFQAALLASLKSEDPENLAKKYGAKNAQDNTLDPVKRAARIAGFDPYSVGLGAEGASDDSDGKIGINVAQLQAFTSDISQWGNVNFWESAYVPKLEIANNVKEACGYEFYQDVDGDLVFKPPFYNLDTSSKRVYRIEDIDIISFTAMSKEPDATVVKVTGGHFRGMTGTGLENNEWGTRAEFIDYRLVAQFGWRQQTFETTYHTDSQAMFFAAIARFDIFNIGMNSATASIPLRPELRPGYPVYIVPLDCFYYLHSFNHSFSYGGQCTTTLNLVGRRAKFFAPGEPPLDGSRPQIGNIRLDNMHLPALPLEITEVEGVEIQSRLQGFPNVVMALDPTLINPLTFSAGIDVAELTKPDAVRSLIKQALMGRLSVLQHGEDGEATDEATRATEGPWQLQTGNGTPPIVIPSVSDLVAQGQMLKSYYDNRDDSGDARARVEAEAAPLLALVDAARDVHAKLFPTDESAAKYLELLGDTKAAYNCGTALPGSYRYYSSSHPDPAMQGPVSWTVSSTGLVETGTQTKLDASVQQTSTQFRSTPGGGTTFVKGCPVYAGIPLAKPGTKDQVVSTPTHQITTFQVSRFAVTETITRTVSTGRNPTGFPASTLSAAYKKFFLERMGQVQVGLATVVGSAFLTTYDLVAKLVEEKVGEYPPFIFKDFSVAGVPGIDMPSKLSNLAQSMADSCAGTASKVLTARLAAARPASGVITSDFGTREAPTAGASTEHKGIDIGAAAGSPIYAVLAGTVEFAGKNAGYGNLLTIRHADNTRTRYAHCESILVSVGDTVAVGQEVGVVGSSGNVTGPHLHFEVISASGQPIDPEEFLTTIGAYDEHDLEDTWASLWPEGSQAQGGVGRKSRTVTQQVTKYYDAPVFPVSDARGYEVIGTYRYGRGLTLESLDELSGFTPTTTEDYETVEAFIDTVKANSSEDALSIAIGTLNPTLKSQLAASTLSTVVRDMIALDNPGGTQVDLGGQNTPASKKDFTQKSTLTNAAYGLADLTATAGRRTVCACKGAEADTLLQAFDSTLFVGVDSVDAGETEVVQDWLTDQMVAASVDWAATQSAYRGAVLDTNSAGLFDAVKGAVANYANLIPSTGAALASATSPGSIQEAQARLDADIADFNDEGA